MLQRTKTLYTTLCFQLCGNSLGKNRIWVSWLGVHKRLDIQCNCYCMGSNLTALFRLHNITMWVSNISLIGTFLIFNSSNFVGFYTNIQYITVQLIRQGCRGGGHSPNYPFLVCIRKRILTYQKRCVFQQVGSVIILIHQNYQGYYIIFRIQQH